MNSIEQHRETEKKFIPQKYITRELDAPTELLRFRHKAKPIEQIYLTHPDDPCSLRVRCEGDTPSYTATLKIPLTNNEAQDSIEVETSIAAETYYNFADQEQLPRIRKDRATILPGVTIDWFKRSSTPLLEVESPAKIDNIVIGDINLGLTPSLYKDVSTDPNYQNSRMAYELHASKNNPLLDSYTQPDVAEQVSGLLLRATDLQNKHERSVVITVAGGSASGKTTRVAKVLAEETGGTLVSMDDYYMGQAIAKELYDYKLADINFDHPEFYRTRLIGIHLSKLALGHTVALRKYQMATAELADKYSEIAARPGRPIILEGIYANHSEIAKSADLQTFVDAPMHIRIMRRIMRDHFSGEREVVFKTPGDHLRYLLEVCEPSFAQHGAPQKDTADIVINT